jgi:hypothetical protein
MQISVMMMVILFVERVYLCRFDKEINGSIPHTTAAMVVYNGIGSDATTVSTAPPPPAPVRRNTSIQWVALYCPSTEAPLHRINIHHQITIILRGRSHQHDSNRHERGKTRQKNFSVATNNESNYLNTTRCYNVSIIHFPLTCMGTKTFTYF